MSFRLIEKQVLYSGQKVQLELHHLEDEGARRTQREVCVHPGAVVILPFLDDKTILLIRQRRYSIGQILVELPAGTLEKGESPMNAAGRELQEETGFLPSKLKPLFNFFPSPGILTEKMYVFAAYDLRKTQTRMDLGEEIETVATDFDDAIQMIRTGEIQDGKSIASLLYVDRFFRKP